MTTLESAFDRLTENQINAIWLGALLTVQLSGGTAANAAADLIVALEARRGREITVLADPPVRKSKLPVPGLDRESLRAAIRDERRLTIDYVDAKRRVTKRTVWPLSHSDFGAAGAMLAWCEKREGFRNFRFDRIEGCRLEATRMPTPRAVMAALAECLMDEDEGW
jgi:predicted DNA-binding transcriptional regulator YafY